MNRGAVVLTLPSSAGTFPVKSSVFRVRVITVGIRGRLFMGRPWAISFLLKVPVLPGRVKRIMFQTRLLLVRLRLLVVRRTFFLVRRLMMM